MPISSEFRIKHTNILNDFVVSNSNIIKHCHRGVLNNALVGISIRLQQRITKHAHPSFGAVTSDRYAIIGRGRSHRWWAEWSAEGEKR